MSKLRKVAAGRRSVLLLMGWYVHEINIGVARYAREAGWILDDASSPGQAVPQNWDGDGIVTLLPDSAPRSLIKFVNRVRAPVVDLSDQLPELKLPRVLPDNRAIGRLGAEEFLGRGFQQLAFYQVDGRAPVVRERMEGFRSTAEAAGQTFTLNDYTPDWKQPDAHRRLRPWLREQLKRLPKPVGVMAQYDAEAIYVIQAALDAGLDVPGQVAVVGADNDPIHSELGLVPLTSVVTNRELLGYKGAELLDHLMKGGRAPEMPLRIAPGGIIVRRSSDVFAAEDPALAQALGYIVAHIDHKFDISEVVTASGVSRRTLYQKFEAYLGRPIHQEIMRQRIALAKRLLRSTNEKTQTIAERCGIETALRLNKLFHMFEKMSPSDFRQKFR